MTDPSLDFQQVYQEFQPRILRYLTRMVGEAEAEDLTQEVFIKVRQALSGFRGDSSLSTWIYRIAANTALDRISSPSFKLACVEDLPEDQELAPASPDVQAALPEDQLFQKEKVTCYAGCIDNLPESYREVVMLSELEDLMLQEIADRLGLSLATVKIRLHRGRARLLDDLRHRCKPEDWL